MNDLEYLATRIEWMALSLERLARLKTGQPLDEIDDALNATATRVADETSGALVRLGVALRLSYSELHCVLLLATNAILPSARVRLASFATEHTVDPTLDTLRRVIYGDRPSREALAELGPEGTLRKLGIIERTDTGDVHESRQTWALSRRVLAFLHGDDSIDPALAGIVRVPADGPALDSLAITPQAIAAAREAMRVPRATILAIGRPGLGRRTLLAAAAHEANQQVLEIDARELARDIPALHKQLRAIARELRLQNRIPLVVRLDALGDEHAQLLATTLAAHDVVLATCGPQRPTLRWNRPQIAVELTPPTSAQRAALWHHALGQGTPEDAEHLANLYPFAPAVIHQVAAAARARAPSRAITPDDIFAAVRVTLDDNLGAYARRVTVTQTWRDLVLPADQRDAIAELLARVRARRRVYEEWGFAAKVGKGLGVSALFSGPPGTGKTMVSALIARDLGLELYQVDMAKITSKWVGETEKQLAALFDAAEAGHAVLLFDEADSLFGKRTEVKSSNDRYANLETNYLLQRLESFTGICLLTTNHESAIDAAFLRRLSLHVRFDLPDATERAQLWRAVLPANRAAGSGSRPDAPRRALRDERRVHP